VFITFTCCTSKNIYKKYIDEYLLESTRTGFKSIENSNYFINKYQLNKDEINNIGCWYINTFVDSKYIENGGFGITVTYFPNRMFRAYKDYAETDDIQYIFGEWKIENKQLQIKLRTRAIKNGKFTWKFETKSNQEYYKILNITKYNYAVINRESYDFTIVPKDLREYFRVNEKDLITSTTFCKIV